MPDSPEQVTQLLLASADGDDHAREQVLNLVYGDLRRLAHKQLGHNNPNQKLSATALVHEAYLKLMERTGTEWNDRSHFFRMIAQAMRRVAIDYARYKLADKRGGNATPVEIDSNELSDHDRATMILELEDVMHRLAEVEPRLTDVVECRFFAGLNEVETAKALGASRRTVQRDWQRARSLLKEFLSN